MNITIRYTEIQMMVVNHLSVIGKRTKDNQGNSLWSNITMQSNEMSVVNDYIKSGIHKIVNTLKDVLTVGIASQSTTEVVISIDNVRWGTLKEKYFETMFPDMAKRFCQNYALSEFLNMVYPELAKKYEVEELSILGDLKSLALMKGPYSSDKEYKDITVTIE